MATFKVTFRPPVPFPQTTEAQRLKSIVRRLNKLGVYLTPEQMRGILASIRAARNAARRSNGPMSETVDRVFSHYLPTLLALRPIAPQREQAEEVAL